VVGGVRRTGGARRPPPPPTRPPAPPPTSFAMLSVGCVRARFSKHICILILLDACASAIGFYLFGYAFAYGDRATSNAFIGSQFFGMSNLPSGGAAGAPQYYQWFFQWSFAATACTIVSGAIAEVRGGGAVEKTGPHKPRTNPGPDPHPHPRSAPGSRPTSSTRSSWPPGSTPSSCTRCGRPPGGPT